MVQSSFGVEIISGCVTGFLGCEESGGSSQEQSRTGRDG